MKQKKQKNRDDFPQLINGSLSPNSWFETDNGKFIKGDVVDFDKPYLLTRLKFYDKNGT